MFCLNFNSFQLCPNNLWKWPDLKSDQNKESVNTMFSSQRLRRNGSVRENCQLFSSSHISCKHFVCEFTLNECCKAASRASSMLIFSIYIVKSAENMVKKASINGIHNPCFPLGINWVVKSNVRLDNNVHQWIIYMH